MTSTDTPKTERSAPLNELLEGQSKGPFWRRGRWLLGALIVVAGLGLLLVSRSGDRSAEPRYETAAATIGTLVVQVSATGNLQPTNQVEVGSELSGIVAEVMVDDNDRVKKGQVLARLDLAKLQDAVARSRATLAAAEAQVLQAEATVAEARAVLERFERVAELSGGKVPSKTELDTARANLKRAQANESSARASVIQARAELQSDETDLGKASIRSPIDGVVLTRQVEPGQTVAATLQAPVLFTLAEDLAKMELRVDVDEADVGQVKVGQRATFTVDAWPGREYAGVITRVGYGSQVIDGVVSYPTVIEVANDDLSLRPGMTGTADIVTLVREDVLLVPNAALRFDPSAASAAPSSPPGGFMRRLVPRPPSQPRRVQTTVDGGAQRVWVLREDEVAPIEVRTGASNGQLTEIVGGPLEAGAEVITERLGPPS